MPRRAAIASCSSPCSRQLRDVQRAAQVGSQEGDEADRRLAGAQQRRAARDARPPGRRAPGDPPAPRPRRPAPIAADRLDVSPSIGAPAPGVQRSLLDLRGQTRQIERGPIDEQVERPPAGSACPRSRASRSTHSRSARGSVTRAKATAPPARSKAARSLRRPSRPRATRIRHAGGDTRAIDSSTSASFAPGNASARRTTSACAPPNSERRREVLQRRRRGRRVVVRPQRARTSPAPASPSRRSSRASARSTRNVSSPCSS